MSLLAVLGEVLDLLAFAMVGYAIRLLADIRETAHGIASNRRVRHI